VVLALAFFPGSAIAAGTVSRVGSTLVFQGSDGQDSLAVEFAMPPSWATEPSYVFRGLPKIKGDDSTTAGDGCQSVSTGGPQPEVDAVCPAAGIEHIDVFMNAGDDFVTAGGYSAMPASISAHGGPGNDSVMGDEKAPSGNQQLFGDTGNDLLHSFSRSVPAHMDGGSGNDSFSWEDTDRGVATFANGGPGDDVFTAYAARGPDTIVTGSGTDYVSVHNRSGDPDTVDCTGSDGLAALYFNPSDHIDRHCKLDVFARTVRKLKQALQRLRPPTAGPATIHLSALRVPGRSR
jgi:Ca2+-binding RTX toxin-like protein